MSAADRLESPTRWEQVAEQTRWGRYISDTEHRTILAGAALAEANGGAGTALEVGCEAGRWSLLLARRGWELVCTDIRPESLEICQERIPAARCVLVEEADTTLPCDTGTVGFLLCIEVPGVPTSDWFLEEAARVLRPGGILVTIAWNRSSLRGRYGHRSAVRADTFDFYARTYRDWRAELLSEGLAVVREEGFCWFPFPRESDSRLVPHAVRIERLLGLPRLPALSPWVIVTAERRA
ncbi:MAG: class I SAM-dependent methyltransferase [Actinobacteria bacterium]|nr:class I SAM-dependent methyltransferase [Actinomycetota bacterium]